MMDDLGLIHMNGRIYDPLTGRFLSADQVIQSPFNLQSYNRYSYCMNSPTGYVDPSGYLSQDLIDEYGISGALFFGSNYNIVLWKNDNSHSESSSTVLSDVTNAADSQAVSPSPNKLKNDSMAVVSKDGAALRSYGMDSENSDQSEGQISKSSSRGIPLLPNTAMAVVTGNIAYVGLAVVDESQLAPVTFFPDSGTIGYRLNGSASYGIGVDATLSIQLDSKGQCDFMFSFGKITSAPQLSLTLGSTITDADSVADIVGWSGGVGGAGGIMVVAGEANYVFAKTYRGADLGVGLGVGIPLTPQTYVGHTWSLFTLSDSDR